MPSARFAKQRARSLASGASWSQALWAAVEHALRVGGVLARLGRLGQHLDGLVGRRGGGGGDEDVVGGADAAGAQRRVAAELVDLEPERVVLAELARFGQPLLGPVGVAGEPGGVGRGVEAAGACRARPP